MFTQQMPTAQQGLRPIPSSIPVIWSPQTVFYENGGLYGMQQPAQQPAQQSNKYTYTPQQWTPPAGLASLANLYGNTSSPWYVGGGNAQSNAQTSSGGNNMGGWDSTGFMQGLQSLGYNI